jgi:hypothetical protein
MSSAAVAAAALAAAVPITIPEGVQLLRSAEAGTMGSSSGSSSCWSHATLVQLDRSRACCQTASTVHTFLMKHMMSCTVVEVIVASVKGLC